VRAAGLAPWARLVLLAPLSGCAAQAAVAGGVVVDRPTGSQSDQVSTALALEGHFAHLGWELESRVEGGRGSMFTTGVQAGYAYTPRSRFGAVGFVGHADYGFPVGAGPAGGYAGITLGLPVSIEPTQAPTRMDLGPLLRYRAYWSWDPTDDGGAEVAARHDLSAGVTLRMRLTSDLLPAGN
jgi:hypothetical protein